MNMVLKNKKNWLINTSMLKKLPLNIKKFIITDIMKKNSRDSGDLIDFMQKLQRNLKSMPTQKLIDMNLKLLVPKLNTKEPERVNMLLKSILELFIRQLKSLTKELNLLKRIGSKQSHTKTIKILK
jgi:NADH dehydrogenase/NADH:ubiquinone oxidoreductase subunit G